MGRAGAALAGATLAGACAARPAANALDVPPPTTASATSSASSASSATSASAAAASPPPEPRGGLVDLVVGADADGLGAGQPVRLALDLRALRARPEAREIGAAIAAIPQQQHFKQMSGLDVFADGEWLVFYGTSAVASGKSTLVVRYTRADADVHPPDATARVFGDVVIRPQAHVVALVADSRKALFQSELARPLTTGLREGELLRLHFDEPSRSLAIAAVDGVERVELVARASDDGGLDTGAEGTCATREACAGAALALRTTVKQRNGTFVRMALRGMLDPLEEEGAAGRAGIRAREGRIDMRLHMTPEHVRALVNVVGASLGAPRPPSPSR